jgi:polysaccharide export outer membrane protein
MLLGVCTLGAAQQPTSTAQREYLVGPDDLLLITVFDEPGLSGRFRVDSEGSIAYPLLGRLMAAGLTPRQVQQRLIELLGEGYLKEPQLSVEVAEYRTQNVFVIGEVRIPGKYTMAGNITLIEALARAGGTTSDAGTELLVVHSTSERADAQPLLPGQDPNVEVARINVADLQSGKIAQNVGLSDGDTIYVPRAEKFFFYVTGEVRSPGSYALVPGLTVLQAISIGGGLTPNGSNRRIKIVRMVSGEKREVGVRLPDPVQAGDTIIVPRRFF